MYFCGLKIVVIKALTTIQAGQEVTVNYGRNFGREGDMKCNCQRKGCVGTIKGSTSYRSLHQYLETYNAALEVLRAYTGQLPKPQDKYDEEAELYQKEVADLIIRLKHLEKLEKGSYLSHDKIPEFGTLQNMDVDVHEEPQNIDGMEAIVQE